MLHITMDQITDEAARMALELRFAHKEVARLEAEVREVRAQLAEHEKPGEAE